MSMIVPGGRAYPSITGRTWRGCMPDYEPITHEAHRLVSGDRQGDYGHPLDDMTRTGRMWAAILGLPEVTAEQVALCMVAVKLSRQCNKPKRDNLVDGCGYLETIDMMRQERARRCG